jgi:DNA-binding CsgD family transcriptional regulator
MAAMRLSPRDLDVLNRAALELHACDEPGALYSALPAIVLRAIPADYFRLLVWDVDPESRALLRFRHWESQPRIDAEMQRRFVRWMPEHPFVIAAAPTGNLDAAKLTDFCSTRQFRRTALYREVYRPIDIGPLMGTSRASGPNLRAISVSRHLGARDFSERDRAMLSLLGPHFDSARRNAARRGRPRAKRGPDARLTAREADVARWLASGKTNPEIATILGVRPRTVEKHVEHILRKLGVDNRTVASLVLADRDGEAEA